MDDSQKEPITLSGKQDLKLCLNCGFPNRNTDSYCMYCRTSLIEDGGLINWIRQTYYILKWRRQLKQKRGEIEKSESKTPFYRTGAYFFMGLLLSGMGIFVLTIAILPILGIGGMELFVAESPGPTADKLHPRITQTAKRLWFIYVGLTFSEIILFKVAGMGH